MKRWLVVAVFGVVTFFVGMYVEQRRYEQTYNLERLKVAISVTKDEDAAKYPELALWAKKVKEKSLVNPKLNSEEKAFLALIRATTFAEQLKGSLCLRPHKFFTTAPEVRLNREDIKVGADLRILFAYALEDYKQLKFTFDGLVEALNESCGFLKKGRELKKPTDGKN